MLLSISLFYYQLALKIMSSIIFGLMKPILLLCLNKKKTIPLKVNSARFVRPNIVK